jgi:hypothetical protein
MNWKSILIVVVLIACLSNTGCKKVGDEIIGSWEFQTFDSLPTGTVSWTFHEGGVSGVLTRIYNYEGIINYDTCVYLIDQSSFKKRMRITESGKAVGLIDINGVYRIEHFKEGIVEMTRIETPDGAEDGAAFLRCELIRKQ